MSIRTLLIPTVALAAAAIALVLATGAEDDARPTASAAPAVVVAKAPPTPRTRSSVMRSPAGRAASSAGVPEVTTAAPGAFAAKAAPTTMDERTAALVTKIRSSGAANEPWMDQARRLIQSGDVECHRAGCVATLSYASELAFETDDERFTHSAEFHAFPGWRHRSVAHDASSGRVTATWFLMRPEHR